MVEPKPDRGPTMGHNHIAHDVLAEMVAQSNDALFVLTPAGSLDYMNPAAERLVGWSLEELDDAHDMLARIHPTPEELARSQALFMEDMATDAPPKRVFQIVRGPEKTPGGSDSGSDASGAVFWSSRETTGRSARKLPGPSWRTCRRAGIGSV
ncbi:MAG: PAS domain S-box protein [Proteobacteria bacterium]|nr:PAS domain S-box protein [Pseudomonadota bacterium]MCP4918150.1 PAS domain S-box protein [Pseudomonadota bacterium]